MIAKTIGLKMSHDPRGKISAGQRNADGRGEKLDHFNVSRYPEVIALYGEKPDKLWVCPTSDDLNEVLTAPFDKWLGGDFQIGKKGTRQRYCDGENCTHRLDITIGKDTYQAGTVTECVCLKHGLFDLPKNERQKQACKCDVNFLAHILHPETKDRLTYHPVRFFTQSTNSARAVLGALTGLAYITTEELGLARPALRGIPLILTVRMVEDRNDPKVKFPVWDLIIGVQKPELVQKLIQDSRSRGWTEETTARFQLMAATKATQIGTGSLFSRMEDKIKKARTVSELRAVSDDINVRAGMELTEDEVEKLRVIGMSRQTEIVGGA